MTAPRRIVVICPGRGSYAADELHFFDGRRRLPGARAKVDDLVGRADALREEFGLPALSALDGAERFSPSRHLVGPNAGPLIYTASAIDLTLIPAEHWKVVGACGNSMGFYTALHAAGVFAFEDAFRLVQTMSSSQEGGLVGGQLIHPVVGDDWRSDPAAESAVRDLVATLQDEGLSAFVSIELGGFLVLAGEEKALAALEERLPRRRMGAREYPFRLAQHAAFHTPLMDAASRYGRDRLSDLPWSPPALPLVDGAGRLLSPYSARSEAILSYTLVEQVLETYRFTVSVQVALRELAPDRLVLLGPGDSLGGAIGQILVREGWQGIRSKDDFVARQKSADPILVSMGRPEQLERFLAGA